MSARLPWVDIKKMAPEDPQRSVFACDILGLHVWEYFHMAPEFIAAFGRGTPSDDPCVSRRCLRCRRMEAWTNDRKWKHRL